MTLPAPWMDPTAMHVVITAGAHKGMVGVVVNHMRKTYGVYLNATGEIVRVKITSTMALPK